MAFDFGFDFNFSGKPADEAPETEEKNEKEEKQTYIRSFTERGKKIFDKKRFFSEQAMLQAVDWHFQPGCEYHCMSGGDVDSLSYLKHVVRQQPLEYLSISTWCIGIQDVHEIKEWIKKGLVKRFDCYLGEIAKASYAQAQTDLEKITGSTGGRCGIFRNHSKVMCCYGEKFDCVILSSANVNTNPRTENTLICCDSEIVDFYKSFYDDIKPFNGSPEDWTPYIRKK